MTPLMGCKRTTSAPTALSPRLVTYSPALTTMVFDMGFGDHIVGVTNYCTLPEGQERTIVGSALTVRAEPILAVDPDVICTQSDPKLYEPLTRLAPHIHIEYFQIETLDEIAAAMTRIGELVERPTAGQTASQAFQQNLAKVAELTKELPRRSTMFVVGYENPFVAGHGTFLNEMIKVAGGDNCMADDYRGWKGVELESVMQHTPAVIICQVDAAKAEAAQAYWSRIGAELPHEQVVVHIVTDERWTIPSGQLAKFTKQLALMIHPQLADVLEQD